MDWQAQIVQAVCLLFCQLSAYEYDNKIWPLLTTLSSQIYLMLGRTSEVLEDANICLTCIETALAAYTEQQNQASPSLHELQFLVMIDALIVSMPDLQEASPLQEHRHTRSRM